MEIEIVTTKKKLTKSIVSQFRSAEVKDFIYCINKDEKCFYIIGLGSRFTEKTGIFKSFNEWVKFPIFNFELSEALFTSRTYDQLMSRHIKLFEITESGHTRIDQKPLIRPYNEVRKRCLENHLFI